MHIGTILLGWLVTAVIVVVVLVKTGMLKIDIIVDGGDQDDDNEDDKDGKSRK